MVDLRFMPILVWVIVIAISLILFFATARYVIYCLKAWYFVLTRPWTIEAIQKTSFEGDGDSVQPTWQLDIYRFELKDTDGDLDVLFLGNHTDLRFMLEVGKRVEFKLDQLRPSSLQQFLNPSISQMVRIRPYAKDMAWMD